MFLPSFSYTPAITELLGEIEVLRGRVARDVQGEDALNSMKTRNAARRAAGACALDGITVSAEQAARVFAAGSADLDPEIELALKNYSFAGERLASMGAEDKPLGVAALMTLHFYLLYDAKSRKQVPGLRRERLALVDVRDGTPLAFAPPPAALQGALQELAIWLHSSRNAVSPILRAAIAHLRLVHLQPFSAANGRAACALANLQLLSADFALPTLPPVEAAHAASLDRYYAVLADARDPEAWTGDVTSWLEYYCDAVAGELHAMIAPPVPSAEPQPPLNARQKRILEILTDPDAALTNQECQRLFDVSPVTAARDFRDLVDRGQVMLLGQGRGSYYVKR